MGLLAREKVKGNRYRYRISNWGKRYGESGALYRQDMVYLKLLQYIVKSDNFDDKKWAERVIVPRLMQRFLRGKKKQDMIPYVDMIAVKIRSISKELNKTEPISIYSNSTHKKVGKLDRLNDQLALKYIQALLSQLHP